ncbi:MAG: hypothetical protein KKG59_05015 [Nanoarchaeota archaeon]|nr:hypothetical protein [Nanoarchaeota archaeon]
MNIKPIYESTGVPMRLAIFMSGSGSNAEKIIEEHLRQRETGDVSFEPVVMFTDNHESRAAEIAGKKFKNQGFQIPLVVNPIDRFYARHFMSDGTLKNMDMRGQYDMQNGNTLVDHGVQAVALAGYDYVITDSICDNFVTMNVHPGDLRVQFPPYHPKEGKRRYYGLAWVPSAKAILNGEKQVYTSVHLVTSELDGGPLLAVSEPQRVFEFALSREELLGGMKSVFALRQFINEHSEMDDGYLKAKFPLYGFASDCQERLKVHGDWVIFPQAIDNMARGFYQKDEQERLYFKNRPIPNGLEMEVRK